MENGIRIRKIIFDQLMAKDNENSKNWEKLCSSDRPVIPFIGAGISAWCYPTWSELLKNIVKDNFSEECADIVERALENEDIPYIKGEENEKQFSWMEEIAECIFDDNKKSYQRNKERFKLAKKNAIKDSDEKDKRKDAGSILRKLRNNVGEEKSSKKVQAVAALYEAFNPERLKEGRKMPEYQNFFHRVFSDILITTNYDKALDYCYPSLLSYSYKDFQYGKAKENWLLQAVEAKLKQMENKLNGEKDEEWEVSVPSIPMLLKIHGTIEHANDIVLSTSKYDKVYKGEMLNILKKFYQESTLIFLGCGLRKDRFLDELSKCNGNGSFCHFAFLPELEDKNEQKERSKKLETHYGIYPIFYDKEDLISLFPDEKEREDRYHDYFLGLLLENLSRRTMYYPQPLELLWDSFRFKNMNLEKYLLSTRKKMLTQRAPQYVHRTEIFQIWKLLNSSEECPLIAITGSVGSGRSTLCLNIQELSSNYKDTMQFFYVPLSHCKRWDEFCLQLFQNLNIIKLEIPKEEEWREVAKLVSERCGGYWRSVLILDQLDELKDENTNFRLWNTIKSILRYWKEHQTRVIFTCCDFPDGINCYTWHIGKLKSEEAQTVFFSACTSKQDGYLSFMEKEVISELFNRQVFRPAVIHLLGRYANSKNDLNSLLEEWELYRQPGDKAEQILARMLWHYLLEEHGYDEKDDKQKQEIEENILWVWGILGTYPGVFPSVFFETALSDKTFCHSKELTEKTLLYMKNAGLCVESGDEQKNTVLSNMVHCVEKFFLKKIGDDSEQFVTMRKNFRKNLDESEGRDYGRNCFRGYLMGDYDGKLREYVLRERAATDNKAADNKAADNKAADNKAADDKAADDKAADNKATDDKAAGDKATDDKAAGDKATDNNDSDSVKDILDFLSCLGGKIENDVARKNNNKLNLVLHYEIKMVIRFLCDCLANPDIREKRQKDISKIGYQFSHYFQYCPNYTFSFAQQLMYIMDHEEKGELCKRAGLNCVMGDIQRLMGRKKEAAQYYKESIRLCDQLMLEVFGGDGDEENKLVYNESLRIKARTLLISNDYHSLKKNQDKMTSPVRIYETIQDSWGEAYYNHRMGEMLFEEVGEREDEEIEKQAEYEKQAKYEKQAEYFKEISAYYNRSVEKYDEINDKMGTAYMLKCMGELIVKFGDIYKKEGYYIKECKGRDKYYQITKAKKWHEDSWIYDITRCYVQAFIYYYGHINWCGFANVIQAMGTIYYQSFSASKNDIIEFVEKIYGMAEECYRWIGDMRGLADTLDYFGCAYRDCGDEKHRYMALSKWMESRKIWKDQGNDFKAKRISREIEKLREDGN